MKRHMAFLLIPVLGLGAAPMAGAGIFGALDSLANAAQASGVNVPSSAYAAGNIAGDIHQAGEDVAPQQPSQPQVAPVCPPGYRCVPSGSSAIAQEAATPPVDPVPTYQTTQAPEEQTMPAAATQRTWTKSALETPHIPIILHQKPALSGSTAPIPGTGDFFPVSERLWRLVSEDSTSFFMGDSDQDVAMVQHQEHGKVPVIYVFLSPNCTLSWDFWRQAQPYLQKGTLDLRAVVVGFSDAMGQAENILSSRVPGVHGAGIGEMAAAQLISNYRRFNYQAERGGVHPLQNAGAERLVYRNMNLLTLLAERAVPPEEAAKGMAVMVTPTLMMKIHGQPYVFVAHQNFANDGALYGTLLTGMEGG